MYIGLVYCFYYYRGTTHFGFSDFPHAVPGYGGQPLDIEVSHKLVVELSHLFLKRFLRKGKVIIIILVSKMLNYYNIAIHNQS